MVRILYLAVFFLMSMAQMGQAASIDDMLRQKMVLSMPKARVTQVIDGQTFVVNNSKTIHLPAIYIPWETVQSQGKYGANAKKFLEELLMDEFVRIYQVRNNERALFNALGHHEGYVTTESGVFVQQAMVEKGLAFAYPTQSHNVVADMLYDAEETARDNRMGLWAEDQWQILSEDSAMEGENRFSVIEGEINKVASRNNVIYLNFGDDWRDDFTVAMDSGLRRDFAKQGMNVMQMGGQTIRVRGWVREYNGPFVEIFDPSQLEIIESQKNENTQ